MKFTLLPICLLIFTSCITTSQSVVSKCKEIRYENQTWMCGFSSREARPLDAKEQKVLELDRPEATRQDSLTGIYNGEFYAVEYRQQFEILTCYNDAIRNRQHQNMQFSILYYINSSGEVTNITFDDNASKIDDEIFRQCAMNKARKAKFVPFRTKAQSSTVGPVKYKFTWKVH